MKKLSHSQVRWVELLSEFDFDIAYLKDTENPAGSLS